MTTRKHQPRELRIETGENDAYHIWYTRGDGYRASIDGNTIGYYDTRDEAWAAIVESREAPQPARDLAALQARFDAFNAAQDALWRGYTRED